MAHLIFDIVIAVTTISLVILRIRDSRSVEQLRNNITLYKQRRAIFDEIRVFLADILVYDKIDSARIEEFYRNTKEARALFGAKIDTLIDEIRSKSSELVRLKITIEKMNTGTRAHHEKIVKHDEIKGWIKDTLDCMNQTFGEYINLVE